MYSLINIDITLLTVIFKIISTLRCPYYNKGEKFQDIICLQTNITVCIFIPNTCFQELLLAKVPISKYLFSFKVHVNVHSCLCIFSFLTPQTFSIGY